MSNRFLRLAAGALLLGLAAACAAPPAERATGVVGAAVERSLASGTRAFDHSAWDTLLREGTRDGLVDYDHMSARRTDLDAYLARLAEVDLGTLARDELKALLINAYNALTVTAILDHPGVASIRDIDGVWSDLIWTVGGHELTLDNIEHNILRPFFLDPRIHFAVNCASRSCAPLPGWAYEGSRIEEQLEERSRAFLQDPGNVRMEDGTLRISRYFDWYGTDFVDTDSNPRAETIPGFIARYASEEIRRAITSNPDLRPEFIDYDWSLNSVSVEIGRVRPGSRPIYAGFGPPPQAVTEEAGGVEDPAGGTGGWVERLREWVGGFGAAGPVVYGLAYVLAVVLLVPASALTIGAGVAFGLGLGTITVALSATTGACLAFLIGRYLLRARVERWLAGREKLSAVDRAVEAEGWRVVALTRLSPAFPFNVQNYFYGLTGVGFRHYALASLFGMVPGTLLYVYIGLVGAEVAEAAGGAAGWGRTALLVAGLAATLLVVVLITRVARRELDKAVGGGSSPPAAASSGLEAG